MYLFTYTAAFLAIVCFGFASYIFSRKPKDIMAHYFILYLYAVTVWIGCNALADIAKTPFTNILWSGIAFIGVNFFVSYYLCFNHVFVFHKRPSAWVRVIYFLPTIFFSLTAFSKYSIADTVFPPNAPSSIVPGPLYTYYLFFYFSSILFGLGLLIWFSIRRATKMQRRQALFMGTGLFILFTASVFFGDILPVFFNEIRFFSVGPQFVVFVIAFSSYAILRHRLFDIEVLIKKGAVFTGLFLTSFLTFSFFVSLFTYFAPGLYSNLLAAAIIAAIFTPLKDWLEVSTDKILFRHRRPFAELIGELNDVLTKVQSVEDIVAQLPVFLRSAVKISDMGLLVRSDSGALVPQVRRSFHLRSVRMPKGSVILDSIDYHIQHDQEALEVWEQDDLAYRVDYEYYPAEEKARLKGIQHELKSLGFKAVVPFVANRKIIGLLFFNGKLSGERFTQTDFRLLEALAHEGSIALDNAINFERTARLNELKNEFVSVVSHQLRTPLIAAKWNAELVLGKKLTSDVADPIGDVQINLTKLNDGLNSMLTVLAIEQDKVHVKKERVNFNESIIGEVLKEFRIQAAKKHVKVSLTSHPRKVFAQVDPEKMRKVLTALISNAIMYTRENSEVSIDVEGDAKQLTVKIEDQGAGVSKKNRHEIFERFFRGADAKKISPDGLGVNLYIARDFVIRHGGKLWVEDREDGESGARFVMMLPT